MAFSEGRIHRGRATLYPWERQALDLVDKHEPLSDTDPHQVWELHDLYDPSSGRLYEIDLLEADGLVEKLSGRQARYVATGDGA